MTGLLARTASAVAAAALVFVVPAINASAASATEAVDVNVVDDTTLSRATLVEQAVSAPAPKPTATPKPDFTARTAAAIRATRSASLYRWGTPTYAQWYAKAHIDKKYNWSGANYKCLVSLWAKESHWRYSAKSRNGKWFGIPQTTRFTITGAGVTMTQYMKNPELQIQVGAKYINYRYGNPCKALSHSKRTGWY